VDNDAPTGIYFIQRGYPIPSKSSVIYYRRGSAASKMSPEDIDEEYIKNSKLLHLTGITPALSDSCREATLKTLSIASESRIMTSLDMNIRLKLWSRDEARETLPPMIRKVNILLTEPADAKILIRGRRTAQDN